MNDTTATLAPELDPAFVFGPTPLEAENARSAAAWEEVFRAGRLLDELGAERSRPCPFSQGAGAAPVLALAGVEAVAA